MVINYLLTGMILQAAPENGWLEYDPASYWVKRPIFRGENVSFREGSTPEKLTL